MLALEKPIRSSVLQEVDRSPLHFLHAYQNDDGKTTTAMRLGTHVHGLIFLPDYRKGLAVFGGKADKRTKAWKEFAEDATERGLVATDRVELGDAETIVESLWSDFDAAPLLWHPERVVEKTLLFDQEGLPCRATPDVVTPTARVELKTTADASDMFAHVVNRFAYVDSQAWYELATGALDCVFVVVETDAPYAVRLIEVSRASLDAARERNAVRIEAVAACAASGVWRGYPRGML